MDRLETRKFSLKQIKANPFRHANQGYRESKIMALVQSISDTGFWPNIIARINGAGDPEIAYGHHRIQALLRVYQDDFEIPIHIRDMSDEDMLLALSHENRTEWETDPYVQVLTVQSALDAFAKGQISLPAPSPKTPDKHVRIAPSAITSGSSGDSLAYTAETLATRLGFTARTTRIYLNALELVESGDVAISELENCYSKDLLSFCKSRSAEDRKKLMANASVRKWTNEANRLREHFNTVRMRMDDAARRVSDDPDAGSEVDLLSAQVDDVDDALTHAEEALENAKRDARPFSIGSKRRASESDDDFDALKSVERIRVILNEDSLFKDIRAASGANLNSSLRRSLHVALSDLSRRAAALAEKFN